MRNTLRQSDASPGRRLDDFLSDRDAVATSDDRKMLCLIAMNMHRRGTTGSCDGFNDCIRAVRIETRKSYRDTLPVSTLMPWAAVVAVIKIVAGCRHL
jgi:hypothetical protein